MGAIYFWGPFQLRKKLVCSRIESIPRLKLKPEKYKGTSLKIDLRYPKESFKNIAIQMRNLQRTLPLVLILVCECRRVTIDIGIGYSFLDFFWNLKVLKHFCWLLEISIIRCCKILLPTILSFGKRIIFNYNVIIIRRHTCQGNSFFTREKTYTESKIYSIYLIELCFM